MNALLQSNLYCEPTPRLRKNNGSATGNGSGALGNAGIETEAGNILQTEAGVNLETET